MVSEGFTRLDRGRMLPSTKYSLSMAWTRPVAFTTELPGSLTPTRKPGPVLLDQFMPVTDGFEAARRMRATPALANRVILALSASVFEEDRRRSATAGCDDFLAKPVEAELLLEKLREHRSLEWICAEEPSAADTAGDEAVGTNPADFETEEIRFPPAAKLWALEALAETGDIRAIEGELDAIEEPAGTYLAFLRRTRELADEYDMGRIVDFLRGCLNPASEDVQHKAYAKGGSARIFPVTSAHGRGH
jgi:CheY-like chemotaxis protein